MRAFSWFVGLIVVALLTGAVLAYPAFELAATFSHFAFHRVASRIAMLTLALLLWWWCRRESIRSKRDFGYGLPWRRFVAQSVLWGLVGIATASIGAWFLLSTHLRVPGADFVLSMSSALKLIGTGLGSGIAVALIEETAIRGAVHTAIERDSGPWVAALLTAPIFALLHFFAKVHIPAEEVGWWSGFDLLVRSFAPLNQPLAVLDSFAAWLMVGLVLSLTRVLTGNIAVAIGLHAGWVVVLRMLQQSTERGPAGPYSAWVGHMDYIVGFWLVPWGVAIALGLWMSRRRWTPAASIEATSV
jgi:uncharacterized protein